MKKSLQFSLIALILLGLVVPALAADSAAIKKELTRLNKSYSKAKSAKQKEQIANKMLQYKAQLKALESVETSAAPAEEETASNDDAKITAIQNELARLNKAYSKAKSAAQKKQIADKMLQYKAQLKALQTPPAEPVALPVTPVEPLTAQPTFTATTYVSSVPTPETKPVVSTPIETAKNFNAITPPPPPKKRLIMPQFGFVASTIYIGGEYLILPTANFDLMMNIGYGYGGSYSLTALGIGALFDSGADTFVETTVTMANYSQKIDNVPGIQGAVEGNVTGIGLYGGENVGNWRIKVGFSTAMGIGISAGYLF